MFDPRKPIQSEGEEIEPISIKEGVNGEIEEVEENEQIKNQEIVESTWEERDEWLSFIDEKPSVQDKIEKYEKGLANATTHFEELKENQEIYESGKIIDFIPDTSQNLELAQNAEEYVRSMVKDLGILDESQILEPSLQFYEQRLEHLKSEMSSESYDTLVRELTKGMKDYKSNKKREGFLAGRYNKESNVIESKRLARIANDNARREIQKESDKKIIESIIPGDYENIAEEISTVFDGEKNVGGQQDLNQYIPTLLQYKNDLEAILSSKMVRNTNIAGEAGVISNDLKITIQKIYNYYHDLSYSLSSKVMESADKVSDDIHAMNINNMSLEALGGIFNLRIPIYTKERAERSGAFREELIDFLQVNKLNESDIKSYKVLFKQAKTIVDMETAEDILWNDYDAKASNAYQLIRRGFLSHGSDLSSIADIIKGGSIWSSRKIQDEKTEKTGDISGGRDRNYRHDNLGVNFSFDHFYDARGKAGDEQEVYNVSTETARVYVILPAYKTFKNHLFAQHHNENPGKRHSGSTDGQWDIEVYNDAETHSNELSGVIGLDKGFIILTKSNSEYASAKLKLRGAGFTDKEVEKMVVYAEKAVSQKRGKNGELIQTYSIQGVINAAKNELEKRKIMDDKSKRGRVVITNINTDTIEKSQTKDEIILRLDD